MYLFEVGVRLFYIPTPFITIKKTFPYANHKTSYKVVLNSYGAGEKL
jgi:hypothetical protein